MYCVYILQNSKGNIYIGQTNNLERRLRYHNENKNLATKRLGGPWRIVHEEICNTRGIAMKRERYLKTGKGREFIKNILGNARG